MEGVGFWALPWSFLSTSVRKCMGRECGAPVIFLERRLHPGVIAPSWDSRAFVAGESLQKPTLLPKCKSRQVCEKYLTEHPKSSTCVLVISVSLSRKKDFYQLSRTFNVFFSFLFL
jgi:hypothetical protein